MKKFVKKTEGFTLVELIVVIAILGILAGVGTVSYSGYIKKANMAADQQLISAIANSLQLQAYSDLSGNISGYVLLHKGANAEASGIGVSAMEAAFGVNWASAAQLAHGEWDGGSTDFLKDMDYATATTVTNSSFLTGSNPTALLGEVSDLTNAAYTFLTNYITNPTTLYEGMMGQFGTDSNEEFNELCKGFGIETKKVGDDWVFDYEDTAEGRTEMQTKISNFMVMAVADSFAKWGEDPENYEPSPAAYLALQYAGYNAFINSGLADEASKTAYENMCNAFKNAGDLTGVTEAMADFREIAGDAYDDYEEMGIAETDSNALVTIMQTVGNASGMVTEEDMLNSDLYTSGSIASYFDSYVAAAGLAAGMEDEATFNALKGQLGDGTVAVYISGLSVGCSAMDAYRPR